MFAIWSIYPEEKHQFVVLKMAVRVLEHHLSRVLGLALTRQGHFKPLAQPIEQQSSLQKSLTINFVLSAWVITPSRSIWELLGWPVGKISCLEVPAWDWLEEDWWEMIALELFRWTKWTFPPSYGNVGSQLMVEGVWGKAGSRIE